MIFPRWSEAEDCNRPGVVTAPPGSPARRGDQCPRLRIWVSRAAGLVQQHGRPYCDHYCPSLEHRGKSWQDCGHWQWKSRSFKEQCYVVLFRFLSYIDLLFGMVSVAPLNMSWHLYCYRQFIKTFVTWLVIFLLVGLLEDMM